MPTHNISRWLLAIALFGVGCKEEVATTDTDIDTPERLAELGERVRILRRAESEVRMTQRAVDELSISLNQTHTEAQRDETTKRLQKAKLRLHEAKSVLEEVSKRAAEDEESDTAQSGDGNPGNIK